MSRHGQQSPGQSHGESVVQYVLDIFISRKAQRDEYRINDAVKAVVKGEMMPGAFFQEYELGALLHDGHHQKRQQDRIGRTAGIH